MADEETVRIMDQAFAAIPLSLERIRELPVELNQFIAVAESLRPALVFEAEPSAFLLALRSIASPE